MNIDKIFETETFRNTRKMPALFVIDRDKHIATKDVNPAAKWVFNEPATATLKKDGTAILVDADGAVFARRAVKKGKKAPVGFRLAEFDPVTGHSFGVEPMETSGFRKFFEEALAGHPDPLAPGTFELVGPKINGNPEMLDKHVIMRHGDDRIDFLDMRTLDPKNAFDTLLPFFENFKAKGVEGIVWWGEGGKRAKLRVKDFFGDPNRH